LVVCDLDRFEIHTNFTGTVKHVHAFDLAGLADPKNLDVLRRVFTDPESIRPGQIADGMREPGIPVVLSSPRVSAQIELNIWTQ
jgi:hypothetical protein